MAQLKSTKSMFKKGQTVRETHQPHRIGKVISVYIGGSVYPVQVDFGDNEDWSYTSEGRYYSTDESPAIEILHNREEGFVPQQIENTYTLEDLRKAFEAGSRRDCDFETWNEN